MVTRRHRFHGHASLPMVYRRAQTVRGPLMALKYLERRSEQPYRAAVVVSRKVSKSAVVRNRIRRRVYETIRACEPDMRGPHELVVMIYSDQLARMTSVQLDQQLKDLLMKANVLSSGEHAIVKST